MVLEMFSVYDLKTMIYHPPMYCHNRGHMMRVFIESATKEPGGLFVKYADDFHLFAVGSFNDHDGKLVPKEPAEFVCSAADLLGGQDGPDRGGPDGPDEPRVG